MRVAGGPWPRQEWRPQPFHRVLGSTQPSLPPCLSPPAVGAMDILWISRNHTLNATFSLSKKKKRKEKVPELQQMTGVRGPVTAARRTS